MQLGISTYVRLTDEALSVNGKPFITNDQRLEPTIFLKELYKKLLNGYSKFHKMDLLSKMSILMMETWLQHSNSELPLDDRTAIIFANKTSSKRTDLLFEQSRNENAASPSLFVYTLPNISIGEVSIKYKWTGESIFLLMPAFDFEAFQEMIVSFSQYPEIKRFICGWIEDDGGLKGHLFIVDSLPAKKNVPFTKEIFESMII